MPIYIAPRKKFKFKITETEFILTKLLLDNLYVDFEPEYKLSFNCNIVSYNGTPLHYSERYASLSNIPNDLTIFRPLKNDKHANVLIDMFEQSNIIETTSLVIKETGINLSSMTRDEKTYEGYFTNNGHTINKSFTYNAPTIPILKSFIIGKMILNKEDYNIFISNLMEYNRQYRRSRRIE